MIEAILRVPEGWRHFRNPVALLEAWHSDDVTDALAAVEAHAHAGRIAVGYVAYEAATALDPHLTTQPSEGPLARFAVFDNFEERTTLGWKRANIELEWRPEIADDVYARGVERIREAIAAGDTYQVNYTLRLRATAQVDRRALFAQISRCGRTQFSAYLDFGEEWIVSASPELFFELQDNQITCRPMKGTAPRGRTTIEDDRIAAELATSEKNRAENLMITDMVRNDLGRIARLGTVVAEPLFEIERYATVHQMTSTIRAATDATLVEIFRAIFPAASMTGAPKRRTMEIIRDNEASPRGVYAGAIGTIGPGRQARMGVAIRTVVGRANDLEYGVGGGIVWDSTATEEAAEWRTKTAILRPAPEFQLVETLRWTPNEGPWLLDRHMARLRASASYFDFEVDEMGIWAAIAELREDGPRRLRLLVDQTGAFQLLAEPLPEWPHEIRVVIAERPVDSLNPLLFHKTTLRHHYPARLGFDETLLVNEHGEVTEGTFTNVGFRRGDQWFTPPVECGLLPGTLRAEMIALGEMREATLLVEQLDQVDELRFFNSVRGWSPAVVLDHTKG